MNVLGTPACFFSRAQSVLALSSAEAELYAIGSTLAELLHARNLLEDLHMFKVSMALYTDSTSVKSLSARFGTSRKTRRAQLRFLHMRQLAQQGMVKIKKVFGAQNPADILTKYVSSAILPMHMSAS